jgi:hypothetical protein
VAALDISLNLQMMPFELTAFKDSWLVFVRI